MLVSIISPVKFYSADQQGAAFYHSITNRILYTTTESIRIHGRLNAAPNIISTTILSFDALARTTVSLATDPFQLISISSPFKIAILSMKPTPQIQYRSSWIQLNSAEPGVESKVQYAQAKWWTPKSSKQGSNAILAFSHGSHLLLMKVSAKEPDGANKKMKFQIFARANTGNPITAIEWLNSKVH